MELCERGECCVREGELCEREGVVGDGGLRWKDRDGEEAGVWKGARWRGRDG